MMKLLIILLYLSNKAFEAVIDYLDNSYLKRELPDNVKDVYDEEEYRKFLAYRKEGSRLHIISDIIGITVTLIFLLLNVHANLFRAFQAMKIYAQYLMVILVFAVVSTVIDLPFDYYDTFVIEEKYGLNKSTKKTFWLDAVKNLIIGSAISYALIVLIMFLFERFGNLAILWCTVAMLVIILVIMLVIIPLMRIYNRFDPLEDGELKDKLLALCDKYKIHVKKIVVRDASRRTTKANAFCTGIGNRKTISLDDNLVNAYSADEIVAVFAHEFAHARYRHTIKGLPFSVCNLLLVFASLAIVLNIPGLYAAFGFDGMNYYFAQMLTGIIIWPISTVIGIIGNYLSRKHEYQADAFAAGEGYGGSLISALKRLNKEALSAINPHPATVVLKYSHPTLSQRIDAIESISAACKKP